MEKKRLKKSNRAYLRKVFTFKALFYPLMLLLVRSGIAEAVEGFLNRIIRATGINKSVHYFYKYRDYSKLFSGHFASPAPAKGEILFPMMFGVHSNFTLLNLLLARYFQENENLRPVFFICDAAYGICTKDGMLKSRDMHPWFCHECWSGYKHIAKMSGITTIRMSSMLTGQLPLIENEEKRINRLSTLEECNDYRFDEIDIGIMARKSVLRYFLEGRLRESNEVISIYRMFLLAGVRYCISFRQMLKDRPEFAYSIINNGTLLFEAIARRLCTGQAIPYMTYETYIGSNSLIYKKNGAVMDFDWQPEYISFLKKFGHGDVVRSKVDEFFENLRRGKEMYAVLNTEHNTERMSGISRFACLFTNLNYDTAVIGRNLLFDSMESWIVKVIEFWKQNVQDITLVIRIHPGEMKLVTASREFLGDRIRAACGDSHKVIVFDSDDKVNSYELIKGMEYGLIYSSTIGLEIAYENKPCIVAGLPWFRDKSFVLYPESQDDYFRLIDELNSGSNKFVPDNDELYRTVWFVFFNRVKRLNGIRLYTPAEEPNTDLKTSGEMLEKNMMFFNEFRDELVNPHL